MPPKKGGKKKKRNGGGKKGAMTKRTLETKGDSEEYAKVIKMHGDRRLNVLLPDNQQIMAIIPGKFRKRVWMNVEDILLVSKREYQENKVDILLKYTPDEIKQLYKLGEIPESFVDGFTTNDDCLEVLSDDEDELDTKNDIYPPSSSETDSGSGSDSEESNIDIDLI